MSHVHIRKVGAGTQANWQGVVRIKWRAEGENKGFGSTRGLWIDLSLSLYMTSSQVLKFSKPQLPYLKKWVQSLLLLCKSEEDSVR